MQLYNVGVPFERIALDVAGSFPITKNGNRYILVIADYFTKWTEAIALPNQEAETIVETLINIWVSRFGVPLELHSDQGRNFDSKIFQELCQSLGIHKTRTTALHPQSDGMVERFNRTTEQHLSKMVSEQQDDWDKYIYNFSNGLSRCHSQHNRSQSCKNDIRKGNLSACRHSIRKAR